MTRTLTAIFSNGAVKTRTTDKPYTHAWQWVGMNSEGKPIATRGATFGFATSLEKARDALRSEIARIAKHRGSTITFQEIVETTESGPQAGALQWSVYWVKRGARCGK